MKTEDLRQYEQQAGVTWCTDCVAFSTYLPQEDVERIERAGRLALCRQTPRTRCQNQTVRSKAFRVKRLMLWLPRSLEFTHQAKAPALFMVKDCSTSKPF